MQDAAHAGFTFVEVVIALLVVVLAGQPAALTPLNAGPLSFSPIPTLGNPAPPPATVAVSQSTYGSSGFTGSPATVNIPVWWYAVLAMTSGFNHAVVEGLPAASDLRTFEQQAHLATIADPRLRQEVSEPVSPRQLAGERRSARRRVADVALDEEVAQRDQPSVGRHDVAVVSVGLMVCPHPRLSAESTRSSSGRVRFVQDPQS